MDEGVRGSFRRRERSGLYRLCLPSPHPTEETGEEQMGNQAWGQLGLFPRPALVPNLESGSCWERECLRPSPDVPAPLRRSLSPKAELVTSSSAPTALVPPSVRAPGISITLPGELPEDRNLTRSSLFPGSDTASDTEQRNWKRSYKRSPHFPMKRVHYESTRNTAPGDCSPSAHSCIHPSVIHSRHAPLFSRHYHRGHD